VSGGGINGGGGSGSGGRGCGRGVDGRVDGDAGSREDDRWLR
jgi:hypothetical protein